jgi:hypothetical protein
MPKNGQTLSPQYVFIYVLCAKNKNYLRVDSPGDQWGPNLDRNLRSRTTALGIVQFGVTFV